jgi:hypothetical protein
MLTWIRGRLFKRGIPSDIDQARQLIRAIDRGGIPLNPARVNAVARDLGLVVSPRAPVDQTIERIRACLRRL